MLPMAIVRPATVAPITAARTTPRLDKLAPSKSSGSRRGNLSCNAVPKWKRNKKRAEPSSPAPQAYRERKPANNDRKPQPSRSNDRRPAFSSGPSADSAPTKRVPKWLKRKKTSQNQRSPGSGPRPVGTIVWGAGGEPTSQKRVPRWLRRAKVSAQTQQQAPVRQQPRQPERPKSSFSSSNQNGAASRRSSSGFNVQSTSTTNSKRYPKWHRRYKKNPGLTTEQEFAIQRDRMAARHNWNSDRSSQVSRV